jgi:hypothetical protein
MTGLGAWIGIEVRENEIPRIIAASDIEQINSMVAPRPPQFVWTMTNYGQTPAFIQKLGVKLMFEETENYWNEPPHPVMQSIVTFIGAGKEETNLIHIRQANLHEVVTRSKYWRVVVKIEYLDAFDKTQTHETMASFHYHVPYKDSVKQGFYKDANHGTNYNT